MLCVSLTQKVSLFQTCENCNHAGCTAIPECSADGSDTASCFNKIQVSEFGSVSGEDKMKAEIFARGPVACYIDAGPLVRRPPPRRFATAWPKAEPISVCAQEDYKSGVNMYKGAKGTDHAIQIAGWGTDNGVDYWLGRNSWGTYWGEHGWFRIARDAYKPEACCKCIRCLCVLVKKPQRSDCTDWAVPVYNGTGYGQ